MASKVLFSTLLVTLGAVFLLSSAAKAATTKSGQSLAVISRESSRRILETNYTTIDMKEHKKGELLVIQNKFGFNKTVNLTATISLSADSNSTTDLPMKKLNISSIGLGNSKDLIVVHLEENTTLNNEYVFLTITNTSMVYRSTEPVYLYYDVGNSGMLIASLVLAIIFMVGSCCCWLCGVRQFYHLIRIPQLIFMLNFISSRPHPSKAFNIMDNFSYNLFRVIPLPIRIYEDLGNECQPGIEFYAEDWSCHAYNSLRNYVLAFFIYLVFYGFIVTNKFQDRPYFLSLKKTMNLTVFMLTIMPDVFIAIYLNAVAGITNSVLSIGFLLSLMLIFWYGYIFSQILGDFFKGNLEKTCEFLKFYIFSRNSLTSDNPKLGLQLLAVALDNLKILIIVTMIALFNNSPKTQMVIVFLVYYLNAVFLIAIRPYVSLIQTIIYAASEFAFAIIVTLLFAMHSRFDEFSMETKESGFGGGITAMVFIIFFLNLCVYIIPIQKGNDTKGIVHKTSTEVSINEEGVSKTRSDLKKEGDAVIPTPVDEKPVELKNHLVKETGERSKIPERDIHTAEGNRSKFALIKEAN
jgi:hypothetical protein